MNGELHVDLDEADFLAVFPAGRAQGRARLIGTVRDERADARARSCSSRTCSGRAIENLKLQRRAACNWFSTYHVHHRVADHFRSGPRVPRSATPRTSTARRAGRA